MGRAIAHRFVREGAAVVLCGRDRRKGEAALEEITADGGEARLVCGNVAEPEVNRELVRTAAGEFGGIDVLVPNAGLLGLGSVTGVDWDTWHETINVNLNGVFYLLRYGIPELQKRPSGAIVVTGSIAAYKGFPNHAAYCASKGALVPFIKQVAVDYGPEIRANIICPGPVDTPLIWDSAAAFPDPEKAVSDVAEKTLLKRLGTPKDIADLALFLAAGESSWITGAAFTIDGGVTCL
jgi:NAD(P)-dependent dehydrogenase (short-subunit alcohol dehydrogenase family)